MALAGATTMPSTTAPALTMLELVVFQDTSPSPQNTVINLEFTMPFNEGVEFFEFEVYSGNVQLAFTLDVEAVPSEDGLALVVIPNYWPNAEYLNLSLPSGDTLASQKNDTLSFRVRAFHTLGDLSEFGFWSELESVRLMGLPSDVPNVEAEEVVDGIEVFWDQPEDTGFGDFRAPVSYYLQASLCEDFASELECQTVSLFVSGTSTKVPDTALFAGSFYFIRVSAQNDLGLAPFADDSFLLSFRILPSILSPQNLPVTVISASDGVDIWADGVLFSALSLVISGFDSELPDNSTFTGVVVSPEGAQFSAPVTALSVTEGGIWSLIFTPPSSDCDGCIFTARIWADGFEVKKASFDILYTSYPASEVVSVYPARGSLFGGDLVEVTIGESTASMSRYAAGEPNLINYRTVEARFDGLPSDCGGKGTFPVTVENTVYEADDVQSISWFLLTVTTPRLQCTRNLDAIEIVFIVDGEDLSVDPPAVFDFRLPTIVPLPDSGILTSGGMDISLFCEDVGALTNPYVTLAGRPCEINSLEVTGQDRSALIMLTIPEFERNFTGIFNMTVFDGDKSWSASFEILSAPEPVILQSSFKVDGEMRTWIPQGSSSATLCFTILNLNSMYSHEFDALEMYLDDVQGTDARFVRAADNVQVLEVTFDTSSFVDGDSPLLTVSVLDGGKEYYSISTFSSGADVAVEIVDMMIPTLISGGPGWGASTGGSVVLLAIKMADSLLDSPESVSVSFTTDFSAEAGEVLGVIGLDDWLAGGSEYQVVMGQTMLWSAMTTEVTELSNQYSGVIAAAQAAAAASVDDLVTTQNIAILVLEAPAYSGGVYEDADEGLDTEPAVVDIQLDGSTIISGSFSYIALPEGGAVVEQVNTDSGRLTSGLAGGVRIGVELSNFAVVGSASEISLNWGGENITVSEVRKSDATSTVVFFNAPAGSPGQVTVRVSPTFLRSNFASFTFTYVDDTLPELVSISPTMVYNDGSDVVTINVRKFPNTGANDVVSIEVQHPDGTTTYLDAFETTKGTAGVTSIKFIAPAGPAGRAVVAATAQRRSVVASLVYVEAPSGNPTFVEAVPSVATCDGETSLVDMRFENMRKVPAGGSVQILFESGVLVNATFDETFSILSTFSYTRVRFTAPALEQSGDIKFELFSSADPSSVANGTIRCVDLTVPEFQFVSPPTATIGEVLTILVHIERFGVLSPSSSVSGVADHGAVVSDVQVLPGSTEEVSQISMTITSEVAGDVNVTLSTGEKTVTFIFFFWNLDPRIGDFAPARAYVYGRTPMRMTILNMPADAPYTTGKIQFGDVNATIDTFVYQPANDNNLSTVFAYLRIPSSLSSKSVVPRLFLEGMSLNAPVNFVYFTPPSPDVTRAVPEFAFTTEDTPIRLFVSDMPGFGVLSQVRVQLEQGTEYAKLLQVVSFEAVNPNLDPSSVQSFVIDALVSADMAPQGTYTLRVWNGAFPRATGTFQNFRVIDDRLPQITRMVSEYGDGISRVSVPMSQSSSVTISIENVPEGVTQFSTQVTLGTSSVSVTFFDYNALLGFVRLGVVVPASAMAGSRAGSVTIGGSQTSFTLLYIDDVAPRVQLLTTMSGPSLGGSVIGLKITNWPVMETSSDAVAVFGSGSITGEVRLVYSNSEETELVILTPSYELGSASSLVLSVSVTHSTQLDKSVAFSFQYYAVSTELKSYAPARFSNLGGEAMSVTLDYFEYPSNAFVSFGGVQIPPEDIIIVAASMDFTSLAVTTPAMEPGTVEVLIKPLSCAAPCADAVRFDIPVFDANEPVLAQPKPVRGPIQDDTFPPIKITNFLVANVSDITVSFENATGAISYAVVTSAAIDFTGATVVVIEKPAVAIGIYLVIVTGVTETGMKEVSFTYEYYDENVPRLESILPESIPTNVAVGSRQIILQSTVSIVLASVPSELAPSDFTVVVGSSTTATVLAVRDIGFGRASLEIAAPTSASPGTRPVTIVLSTDPEVVFACSLTYESTCDFDAFCAQSNMVVDTRRLVLAPSIACSLDVCLDPNSVEAPTINSLSPTEGPVTGGTEVTVAFENLPAFSTDDLTVSIGSGSSERFAPVISLTQAASSTTASGSGSFVFRTPAVPAGTEDVTFRVLVQTGAITRATSIWFEYLPVYGDAPVIAEASPSQIYASQNMLLFLSLTGTPRLSFPYDTTKLQYTVDGFTEPVTSVLSSSRESTSVTVNVPGPFTPGDLEVQVFSSHLGADYAASFFVTVLEDPTPKVQSAFPGQGQATAQNVISVVIAALPVGVNETFVSGSVVTASSNIANATLIGITPFMPSSCASTVCTLHEVQFLIGTNPDGDVDSSATLFIHLKASNNSLEVPFQYISSTSPTFEFFNPRSVSLDKVATTPIIMYINNFPSVECGARSSCAEEAVGGAVMIGQLAGTLLSAEDRDGFLVLQITAPVVASARSEPVSLSVNVGTNVAVTTAFSFRYEAPWASVAPIDGRATGGSEVTVTALGWGRASAAVQLPSDVTVDFGGVFGSVIRIEQASFVIGQVSIVKVVVRTPPSTQGSGPAACSIKSRDGTQSSSFKFLYYEPASAIAAPATASTLGMTSAEDGVSTVITINEFPVVSSAADIEITFGDDEPCDGYRCGITRVDQTAEQVHLTVTVPSSSFVGDTTVEVRFIGQEAPPVGKDPTLEYPRETKVAVAPFSYFLQSPVVDTVRFCDTCVVNASMCIVTGRCGGGVWPLQGRVPSESDGARVASVLVRYAPVVKFDAAGQLTDDFASVRFTFGESLFGTLRRVVQSNTLQSVFEVEVPESSVGGVFTSSVSIVAGRGEIPVEAPFSLTFFDDNIRLRCKNCEGPTTGAPALVVGITSFQLSTDIAPSEQIIVKFGLVDAASVTILSSNATLTLLSIEPPSAPCPTCSFESGSSEIDLSVALMVDDSVSVSTEYTLWKAPDIVSAQFDPYGTSIVVAFDQATDRAGMGGNLSCSLLFTPDVVSTLGGQAARCMWLSDEEMKIFLGAGATVEPGSLLVILEGVLHSANGLSVPSMAEIAVEGPEFPVSPHVTISGPHVVDPCSPLRISAFAASVRPVSWQWSCDDCGALSTYLTTFTGETLVLSAGTPQMETAGQYDIMVTAVDFLGGSTTVMHDVTKLESAAPQLSFSPQVVNTYWDKSVFVRANTVFSSCPIEEANMVFEWSQATGPTLDAGLFNTTTSQLLLAPYSLSPGSVYIIQLSVTMDGDSTKTSSSFFTIIVGSRDLVALIAGGSELMNSAAADLVLDASGSIDGDAPAGGDQGLEYEWSCSFDSSPGNSGNAQGRGSSNSRFNRDACFDTNDNELDLAEITTPTLTIAAGTLPASNDNPYEFTVKVRKGSKTPATFTMPVWMSDQPIPSVAITPGFGTPQSDGSIRVNRGLGLVLYGDCSNDAGAMQWSSEPRLEEGAGDFMPFGTTSSTFKLDPGSGAVSAAEYILTLTCTDEDDNVGSSSMVIKLNDPPQGDLCQACVVKDCEIGTEDCPCEDTGTAVMDQFQYTCRNWADSEDPPLEYKFGYTRTDENDRVTVVEFEWGQSPDFYIRFPAGSVEFNVAVRDLEGAESPLMTDSVTVTTAASAGRRSLQSIETDATFLGFKALVEAELQKGQGSEVNKLISTLAQQTDTLVTAGTYSVDDAEEVKLYLLDALLRAEAATTVTSGYACATINAAQILSKQRQDISTASSLGLSELVGRLMGATWTDGGAMTAACGQRALDVLANAAGALDVDRSCWSESAEAAEVDDSAVAALSAIEVSLDAVALKVAAGYEFGEPLRSITTNSSSHLVGRGMLSSFLGSVQPVQLSTSYKAFGASRSNVTYSLPTSLAGDIGKIGDETVALQVSTQEAAPFVGAQIPISPMVTIAFMDPATGLSIPVSGLTSPVSITIPMSTDLVCEGSAERVRGRCMYWDGEAYNADGCTTVESSVGSVTCQCTHLTSFVVVPYSDPIETTEPVEEPEETEPVEEPEETEPVEEPEETEPVVVEPEETEPAEEPEETEPVVVEPEETEPVEPEETEPVVVEPEETVPETTATFVIPDAPTFSAPDTTLGENGEFSNFVVVTIASTSDGIAYTEDESSSPSCNDMVSGNTVTVTLKATTTLTAVSCAVTGLSSAEESATYTVTKGSSVVLSLNVEGVDTLSDSAQKGLATAFAARFGLLEAQVELDVTTTRRRLLAVGLDVTLLAANADELAVIQNTADNISDDELTSVAQAADPSLADVVITKRATTTLKPTPPTPKTEVEESEKKTNVGLIAGIAVACFVTLTILLGSLLYLLVRRRKAALAEKQPAKSKEAVYFSEAPSTQMISSQFVIGNEGHEGYVTDTGMEMFPAYVPEVETGAGAMHPQVQAELAMWNASNVLPVEMQQSIAAAQAAHAPVAPVAPVPSSAPPMSLGYDGFGGLPNAGGIYASNQAPGAGTGFYFA